MGFIQEWIKNGKIKKFKKRLTKAETYVEKQEALIIGREKELHNYYLDLDEKQNEIEDIKNQLKELGYEVKEEPVTIIENNDVEVEEETAIVVKKDSTPVIANAQSDIKVRVGKSVLSLNKISREEFMELLEKKYNLMISAYDKVMKVLYPQIYMGEAESIQRENYIREITLAYNAITSKYGNIYIDKAIDFLHSTIDVGISYELELQKKTDIEAKKFSNMEYKSLSAFIKNPVTIPTNAMKINVSIRSDINRLNKMVKLANIGIYLFEAAKYSKEEAKEKFYEDNKYESKYINMPYKDIMDQDYFYYNQTQCEVIGDKVLAKNTVNKAMYQSDLRTGFIEFVEPSVIK